MAIGINGNVEWGILPLAFTNSPNNNLYSMSADWRFNYLVSANQPLRYQIIWTSNVGGTVYEDTEPSKDNFSGGDGDVVNVVFKIYATAQYPNNGLPPTLAEFDLVAEIKKSRDIANKHYTTEASPEGHRFTIDISEVCSNLLSYSLVPIGKGTWQSAAWGGMNGGLEKQDNVTEVISPYNVSPNGTFRAIIVDAEFEVINANGNIVSADIAGITSTRTFAIRVINSVAQFEKDTVYLYNSFNIDQDSPSALDSCRFLTRCPNWYHDTTANKVELHKKVRMDEEAEWLYFFPRYTFSSGDPTDYYNIYEIYGRTYDEAGDFIEAFVFNEFAGTLDRRHGNGVTTATHFEQAQNRMCVQNVSPTYINAHAYAPELGELPYNGGLTTPIDSNVHRYRLYVRGVWNSTTTGWTSKQHSAVNWYEIDREDENNAYGFVRFHWLNTMGGIDSYTAKRNITEGYSISKDIIERKSADRTWYQDDSNQGTAIPNSNYISNTMRGGNLYKGGREVSNVSADRKHSVFTEPLNTATAEWLKEILLSPNVWVEFDTDATARGNTVNPYQRPSTKGYMPVIITNSDIETINQEAGLVTFNIEYTLAHKVQTQRN